MMSTKTLIPQRRRDILRRPRLVEKIRGRIERAMSLVSAPAGYGKTSLLVDLVDDVPFPVCWLSLDESDQDFHTFVNDLVAAIQRCFPDFGEQTLRALDADIDAQHKPVMLADTVVRDLMDNAPDYFVLILDDFHTVDRAIPVGQLLGTILKHPNRHWHFVISGRTVPGYLPFIYLMAHNLVAFVSQDDLAFTVDEVQQVLEHMHNLVLTPEQAGELVAASEGWITGIVLATTSMWHGIRDALTQAKSQDGPIYAYLAGQAFEEQPRSLRETMLTMSILPEMNEYLCRQALGLNGAESVLKELERRGLFLTKVVDEAGVRYYRYHHLFRDFLQTRLREQDLDRFRRLHQQAAEWYETNEEWVRAVTHRRAADDARTTAQTMENGAKVMFLSGRLETLISWYETVPESLRAEVPRLLLFVARSLFNLGRTDEAMPLLRQAEVAFKKRGEVARVFYTMLQRANVWYVWGRYADTLAVTQEVLESTDLSAPIAEAHRLAGLACLGLGRSEEAVNHFSKSLDLYRELGLVRETAMTHSDISLALFRLGRLNEGWVNQDKAVELLRRLNPSHYLATVLNNIACERYYLAGDYKQALTFLHEALEVALTAGSPRAQAVALLSTADLYCDLGAIEEAQRLYERAGKIARQLSHTDLINFALLGTAQTLLQAGDVVEALGLAIQVRSQAEKQGNMYQLGLSCLVLGVARIKAGDPRAALAEISYGRDQLEKSGARRELTRAYMLLARAHQAVSDVEGALEALRQALDVGVETQTFHYLVTEGRHVFDLLKQMLRQNPADRRSAQIIDRIRAVPGTAREVIGEPSLMILSQYPSLRFYGFGPGRVEKDGKVVALNLAKARYMIFYLLTHPPRSRDQIFAIFWSDIERSVSTFHSTKCQAHKAIGRRLIAYEDGFYKIVWDPDCWFDVNAFKSLLDGQNRDRQAQLEEAVSLYQGDFLEGYDAEWCLPIRENLRMRYRDALLELGKLYTERKEFASAVSTLNWAVTTDDLHEPSVRALMRLYVLDGRPGAALDIFQQLKQRLQKLRALPEQETQLLCQSIQVAS
jgi:ATP/maltotriose-dependent transcriptional regulator MalT/DNA-binding SARP family transcriptional activator